MPVLKDLQQRARELGRIRIGASVIRNGKKIPSKLDAYRFTTNSPRLAQRIAEAFGGDVQEWEGGTESFDIFTTATELNVIVPPGEAVSTAWELWSGGGIQRRCDGETDLLTMKPCMCPGLEDGARRLAAAKGLACKATTRLKVILPDLPDIGVWRYESHSYNAAVELAGAHEMLRSASESDRFVPAVMRIESRSKVVAGQTNRWNVVVLEVAATVRELLDGTAGGSLAQALPPAPSDAKAIEAPKAPAPALDETPGSGPVGAGGTPRGQRREPAAPGAPTSAQGIADEARVCTDLDRLRALYDLAHDKGWDQELVADNADLYEALDDVILARKAELDKAGAA